MKQEAKDRGLRKAMSSRNNALPSNFTFCTMQKIEEYIRIREKRTERLIFYSIVAVSAVLSTFIGIFMYRFYGDELTRIFKDTTDIFLQLEIYASPYMHFAIIFFILVCFDHWMRRSYFKQHKNRE